MKRWLIWFGIGIVLMVIQPPDPFHTTINESAVFFLEGVWMAITAFAIPIGIIYWLVKGRTVKG